MAKGLSVIASDAADPSIRSRVSAAVVVVARQIMQDLLTQPDDLTHSQKAQLRLAQRILTRVEPATWLDAFTWVVVSTEGVDLSQDAQILTTVAANWIVMVER